MKTLATETGSIVLSLSSSEVGSCYSCGEPISSHDEDGLCESCNTDRLEQDAERFAWDMEMARLSGVAL